MLEFISILPLPPPSSVSLHLPVFLSSIFLCFAHNSSPSKSGHSLMISELQVINLTLHLPARTLCTLLFYPGFSYSDLVPFSHLTFSVSAHFTLVHPPMWFWAQQFFLFFFKYSYHGAVDNIEKVIYFL